MNSMPKGYDTHRSKHSHRVSVSQGKGNSGCENNPPIQETEHVHVIQPESSSQKRQSEHGDEHFASKEQTDEADVPQIK